MKTVVLIPAYNASKTITRVIERIPQGLADEIIVVNDGSRDNTQEVLERIPSTRVITHPQNRGYGAAQITELPTILAPLRSGSADVVAGSRTLGLLRQAKPLLGSRVAANLALTALANLAFHTSSAIIHSTAASAPTRGTHS